jgi:hypothetical protein
MSDPTPIPTRRTLDWRWLLLVALWAIVAVRIGSEFTGRSAHLWHHDLGLLYEEQATFYRGEYPAWEVGEKPREARVGTRSDYPPYSFPLALPWLPPGLGWVPAQIWFVFCQLVATAIVAAFAWSLGRKEEPRLCWLLVGGVLAMTGLRADLLFGNYAVLMTAMLVGLLLALERGRWPLAGAAWVGSLLKPQMGWLFGLLFLSRRGARTLIGAGAALVLLALAACWWTDVTILEVLRSKYSSRVSVMMLMPERISAVSVLTTFGVDAGIALPVCAVAGVALTAWLLHTRMRTATTLTRVALVAVINRLCTYHNACDDLLLVFALCLLGRQAWRSNRVRDWAPFLLLGATVWAPTLTLQSTLARVSVVLIWIGVTIVLAGRVDREAGQDHPSARGAAASLPTG